MPLALLDRGLSRLGVRLRRQELDLEPGVSGDLDPLSGSALHRLVLVSDAVARYRAPFEFEDDPVEALLARRSDLPQDRDGGVGALLFSGLRRP